MHDHAHSPYDHTHDHGPGPGHNRDATRTLQWQQPHLPAGVTAPEQLAAEPDFDLIEASFAEGFATASDPTSFLRLAGVPFSGTTHDGTKVNLLRVELDLVTDIGSVTPHLGGGSFRYDPLPAKMVSRRRKLRFAYQAEGTLRHLTLAEAKALTAG